MIGKRLVQTDKAPAALGPYSQAVVAAGLVFCAGQIPFDPANGTIPSGIEAQTRQALANLAAVLDAAGTGMGGAVKTTVFLKNMNDFAAMNAVYATFFPDSPPARSTVEVARLPRDVLVEVEAVAVAGAG